MIEVGRFAPRAELVPRRFATLADLMPGADAWPRFTRNASEHYEARLSMVEVVESPSIFTAGMAGSQLPIAVPHGEGFADFLLAR